MKTNQQKRKHRLKWIVLQLGIFIVILNSCSIEESIGGSNSKIKTVTKEEAISFLKIKTVKNRVLSKIETPAFDYSKITHEKLTNTDQLLTVVPFSTNTKIKISSALLLKIENNIQTIVYTEYPDATTTKNFFSGIIIMTTLEGDFIRAYRLKNNNYVIDLVPTKNKTIKTGKSSFTGGDIFAAGIELDEVIIYNNYQNPNWKFVRMEFTNPDPTVSDETDLWWMANGGGTSTTAEEGDPCPDGPTTNTSQSTTYSSALSSILAASVDGKEHSITLGRDSNGQTTQAPMNTGGQYNVATNTSWPGAFAAIHNHVVATPLSAGDIYASVKLNSLRSDFTTSFIVLPDGVIYAILVTDLVAAQAFVVSYPADVLPGYSPEFPTFIFDQIDALKSDMGYDTEARTTAIAFVLDKYNAGITLLRQDSAGNFNSIKTEENIQQDGAKTYTPKPCN
ncbi:hypothetical protein [Flavobacterium sp.]|uniref:hypothetical protein n=1 Tax=Flavobacterium sp. TaxID=239 RepID=UPI00286B9894|nr:hypothetical protein [Flavobacterium sp.]